MRSDRNKSDRYDQRDPGDHEVHPRNQDSNLWRGGQRTANFTATACAAPHPRTPVTCLARGRNRVGAGAGAKDCGRKGPGRGEGDRSALKALKATSQRGFAAWRNSSWCLSTPARIERSPRATAFPAPQGRLPAVRRSVYAREPRSCALAAHPGAGVASPPQAPAWPHPHLARGLLHTDAGVAKPQAHTIPSPGAQFTAADDARNAHVPRARERARGPVSLPAHTRAARPDRGTWTAISAGSQTAGPRRSPSPSPGR